VCHGEEILPSGHVIGTYRMGTDPGRSVVNVDQRTHDHPNLFLLGSGVFPTSAASNPTLTIAALALRAVRPVERAMTA
jgi:choline dehydrogenase-like flavoprotein